MKDFYLPEQIKNIIGNRSFSLDDTGMSDSSVFIFDDMVLKIQKDSAFVKNEHAMMNWFENKEFVPKCLYNHTENGINYLLMSKISGKMACDEEFMLFPSLLIDNLANAFDQLWSTDISRCPVKNDLSTVLPMAAYRVEHGLVGEEDAEPGTFGKDGFKDPQELLEWLYDNRPDEDFVLTHGDFCLPNIFIEDGKFSGFVDIGRMGVADRYQDIAICLRSLRSNFSGRYGGKIYGGFNENDFFKAIGIEPDWDKIRYYILLDELF